MSKPSIETTKPVVPQIYCYTTPEISRHEGWSKIGYTEQAPEKRIKQQTHTVDVNCDLKWHEDAMFSDGSGERFKDKEFHAYLRKLDIKQQEDEDNEWFQIQPEDARLHFWKFRSNWGILETLGDVIPYTLKEEQAEAVERIAAYFEKHPGGEFLWNAKPRFGKTLAVYDFCKKVKANKVLIVTNRPAIANSWYNDYERFLGPESGYYFVSEASALKGKKGVISGKQSQSPFAKERHGLLEFVSLQDLKGSLYFGGKFDKLKEIADTEWDVLVVDEAHEGVDTCKTDVAFEQIRRRFTLHLSGTPFKALANAKFADEAIFNWTYADEQERKEQWDKASGLPNPYEEMPKLHLYTYQMSEIVADKVSEGVNIEGDNKEYAFDLNEFFRTDKGKFVYADSVDKFLDALTCLEKYPFSTPELREELKHTFWLLDRVDSAKALAKKLEFHPIFKDYEIILAAGDGKLSEEEESAKAYDKVVGAIRKCDKTITLSVGQLTTGITVPQWSAVLMLCNLKSPALYMQAAFRAQNPCLFQNGTKCLRKINAYVFDFDPVRTLKVFEQFANNLFPNMAAGRGTTEERESNIRRLLNFFPVIGEDDQGALIELDAKAVLSIPRRIRSREVVSCGFMSNFLFQNINRVFAAPGKVESILTKLIPFKEPQQLSLNFDSDLPLDEKGEIELTDEYIIGAAAGLFGDKIYGEALDAAARQAIDEFAEKMKENPDKKAVNTLKKNAAASFSEAVMARIDEGYDDLSKADRRAVERQAKEKAEKTIEKISGQHTIELNKLDREYEAEQQNRFESGRSCSEIDAEFAERRKEAQNRYQSNLAEALSEAAADSIKEAVKTVEENRLNREKTDVESGVRDRLRGFSRTIPAFLMAYGDENTRLDNFDTIVPPEVFREVTGITLEEFLFLRDGGDYEEEGEIKHFEGRLFDEIVFNDSVKEFLDLKKKLANYFESESRETIFDYIPPQKTNQIFTPKKTVEKMVDMLAEENPGCFADPDHTFIDLYMKSGLYIAEIVKRLYQNEKMRSLFPKHKDRLRHIFAKQVYGLAPTEIIYRIVLSYVLGFDEKHEIKRFNLKLLDTLPYVREGTLEDKLAEIF